MTARVTDGACALPTALESVCTDARLRDASRPKTGEVALSHPKTGANRRFPRQSPVLGAAAGAYAGLAEHPDSPSTSAVHA
ncbi:MAG TPA: hypothetical protein VN045_06910, partial [Microbacteriaceae bacterium]|nr:hypothetical protein [Microbacteriaceae bacterium]